MLRRIVRAGSVLLLLAGISAVPVARVAACDCMFVEIEEAVRQADIAFVGRLEERVPGGDNLGFPVVDQWRWFVERNRDPEPASSVVVEAWQEDGANCGVAFGAGERWLVVAYLEEGRLTTTGCQPNRRLDGSDPEAEARIAELITIEVEPAAPSNPGPNIPGPLLVIIAAIVGIGGVAMLAFQRESRPHG